MRSPLRRRNRFEKAVKAARDAQIRRPSDPPPPMSSSRSRSSRALPPSSPRPWASAAISRCDGASTKGAATTSERDRRAEVRRGDGRATATLIAVPDRRRRLSDGLVVEASIVARLFRFRLLAIDAGLVVSPARVAARPPAVAPPTRPRAIGGGLAAAERCLDEGAAHLAASRVTSPRPRARRLGVVPWRLVHPGFLEG